MTSTARTSYVSSSIPMWFLRQIQRLIPPSFGACHSPSPSTVVPVLSMRRSMGWFLRDTAGSRSAFLDGCTLCLNQGHRIGQPYKLQQALQKACYLPEWYPEQHLQGQAYLDRSITEMLSATAFATRGHLFHIGIATNRERSSPPLADSIRQPVRGLVLRSEQAAHTF